MTARDWKYAGFLVALIAGYALMLVVLARVYDDPSPVPDISTLPNSEYLDAHGTAIEVLPGCPLWAGNSDDLKTLIFWGDEEDNLRITAVCVPKVSYSNK